MTKKSSRWLPGQSGNAQGRPRGQSAITRMRAVLEADAPEILARFVTAAKAGNLQAARLILERVLPPLKPIEQSQVLTLSRDASLSEQGRAVMAAVADGEFSPSQGVALLGALGTLAHVIEIDELAARIAVLEKRHEQQT